MILRYTTEVQFDMKKCRERIRWPRVYNREERRWLLSICDLFEMGRFEEAFKVVKSAPDDWLEYMDEPIYNALRDWANGADVAVVPERPCVGDVVTDRSCVP